jgi:Holliday junction resolvase RusA-like endonuclease
MSAIEFTVPGLPIPQGSTRAFGRGGHVHTTNDPTGRIERWRGDIRTAARPAIGNWTGPGLPWAAPAPVKIAIAFRFPRPKGHFLPANARRQEPELRPDAPRFVTSGNDADKLSRAVLDALTAVLYADDGQVVGLASTKRYADPGEHPGADVAVELVP